MTSKLSVTKPSARRIAAGVITLLAAQMLAPAAKSATATTVPPNLLFDLSRFKLTLPVDANGGVTGAAHTIRTTQLNGQPGYSSSYFYSDSNGAMVFYAPSNGAVTTPGVGSDHTRSELREVYGLAGATEWTNRQGGTLSARLRVNKVAVKSKDAVVAQIHGLSNMMMLLAYNPTTKTVVAKLYPTPDSTMAVSYVVASNLILGAAIRYRIQWIGSNLSITVNQRVSNWLVSPAWNDIPVYFKAGAYSAAPNVGNPAGDATKVSFYELDIRH